MRRERVISGAAVAWTAGRLPAGGYFALVRRQAAVGAARAVHAALARARARRRDRLADRGVR